MLTITFDKSKLKSRPLSAIIKYLAEKYINKGVITDNTIFFTAQQINILKKAALLENAYVEDNHIFSYTDVFNKEQSFTKEDLLTFASNVKNQSLTVNYYKKVRTNKLTKERLQFMYADCVNKLYEQCSYSTLDDNIARKINHYRQLLSNNRDTWDYLFVKDMPSVDFYLKYNHKLKAKALDLDPKLSTKELMYKIKQKLVNKPYPWTTTQPPVTAPRTIEWELEQYALHKAAKQEATATSNQYKITITDCATGDVVQEFYLPKSV